MSIREGVGSQSVVYSATQTRIWPYLNPLAMFVSLWSHRALIKGFAWRDIEGRYRGSLLGLVWSLIFPVVNLLIFTFVFGVVFKARWPHERGGESLAQFSLVMFAGMIAFQLFSEPTGRASNLIIQHANFVKKVVFPLEVLPVAMVLATLFHVAIAALILVVGSLLAYGGVPWTVIVMPAAILPLLLMGLGMTWFLSALGVYFRDLGMAVTVVLQLLFYASPIFYPVSAVPIAFRSLVEYNPLTPGIQLLRDCLVIGEISSPNTWLMANVWGGAFAILGYAWFMITRKGFSDVV